MYNIPGNSSYMLYCSVSWTTPSASPGKLLYYYRKRITYVSYTPSNAFSVWLWLDKSTVSSCEFAYGCRL